MKKTPRKTPRKTPKECILLTLMPFKSNQVHNCSLFLQQKPDITSNDLSTNDPRKLLKNYCLKHGLAPPTYASNYSRFNKYEGVVTVDGKSYSSLPLDYTHESDAHAEAASVALRNINTPPPKSQQTSILSEEIAEKLYEIISNKESGVFMKYLPEVFE